MKKYLLILSLVFGLVIFQSQASNLPECKGSYWTKTWTNCFGTLIYANGNKYVGEFKDYTINGKGTFTYANGDKYVGEWKDGKLNGEAIQYYADGSIKHQGIFKDDEFQYAKKGEPEAQFNIPEKPVGKK